MCKVFCNKCGHKCSADDLLKGFNPFSGYNLLGCPECYYLDGYTVAIPLANYLGNKADEYFKARHKQ